MYKKIKNASFMNWIWFIVYMLPLIFLFINMISFPKAFSLDSITTYSLESFGSYINNISSSFDDFMNGFSSSFIFTAFYDILNGVFHITEGDGFFLTVLCELLSYFTCITLIHLAFDFMLLLPNICHKFMEKIGGERD